MLDKGPLSNHYGGGGVILDFMTHKSGNEFKINSNERIYKYGIRG